MTETTALDALPAAGLEQRFETFVVSHRERAVRLAWRLVGGDDAAAQDVAQEAFASAYGHSGASAARPSLGTWFYRILVRKAHSHRRWQAVRARWHHQDRDPPDPAPAAPGDTALRRRLHPGAPGRSWEAEVFSVDADGTLAEEEYLPDEYMVIAFAFLDET